MLTPRRLLVSALFAALAACQPAAPAGLSDADRASITRMDEDFTRMAIAADYATLVKSYYTDDASFMAPNMPAATGSAAIEATLRSFPPITSFTIRNEEIEGAGNLAYARGRYVITMTPPGGAAVVDSGKSMVILRKQADGSWKVSRDMFNSDVPLPMPAPEPVKPGKPGN